MWSFAVIGGLCTAAYLGLFVLFRPLLGAQPANLAALLITAIGNTAANRRLTFGVQGEPDTVVRHHMQGLVVFVLALALSSGAIWAVHALWSATPRPVEVAALVVANVLSTSLRFVLLKIWVFATR
jgi:putative flippase GtrA